MPAEEIPDADPQGKPAGKSLSETNAAATESGKDSYNKGSGGDHDGGGAAELQQKRKDELPKSVVDS